jgi:prepilin-type N-terminal cleavage/methylation domain-containing protein
MLLSNRTRRGFSLTEVIVALFIMAIGIISLLTLFPLGAVQMGKALRDDRSQTTGVIADGKMRLWWQLEITDRLPGELIQGYFPPAVAPYTERTFAIMDGNLGGGYTGQSLFATLPQLSNVDTGPSYPVFCDPVGWHSYTGAKQVHVASSSDIVAGTTNYYAFPRFCIYGLEASANANTAVNFATMPDDITFKENATPAQAETTADAVVRQGRFNFGVVLQRPNNAQRGTVNMKVLVFDRRTPGVNATNEFQVTDASLTVGSTQIITTNAASENLRVGSWIMDGTILSSATLGNIRNAQFYRVVSVEKDPATGVYTIDLETPIQKPTGEPAVGISNGSTPYVAQLYVFSELIDVFDRPPLTPSNFGIPQP